MFRQSNEQQRLFFFVRLSFLDVTMFYENSCFYFQNRRFFSPKKNKTNNDVENDSVFSSQTKKENLTNLIHSSSHSSMMIHQERKSNDCHDLFLFFSTNKFVIGSTRVAMEMFQQEEEKPQKHNNRFQFNSISD